MILVIIDRDGTIIKNDCYFGKDDNWKNEIQFNDDVIDALKHFKQESSIILMITNQAGVAREFFTEERVCEINDYIRDYLSNEGIILNGIEYCPNVDEDYALRTKYKFNKKYVKKKTKRKPNIDMVIDCLSKLNKKLNEFDRIVVIGNSIEDEVFCRNLNGIFIDVNI